MAGIGIRRQARIIALQTLYEHDTSGNDLDETLERHADVRKLDARVLAYARELAHGVIEHLAEIDPLIAAAASEFPLAQMARIDRNILRVAIYEILYNNSVPAKAAINEAVELAKMFGSDASSRFINGVLGTILSDTQRMPATSAGSED